MFFADMDFLTPIFIDINISIPLFGKTAFRTCIVHHNVHYFIQYFQYNVFKYIN